MWMIISSYWWFGLAGVATPGILDPRGPTRYSWNVDAAPGAHRSNDVRSSQDYAGALCTNGCESACYALESISRSVGRVILIAGGIWGGS